VVVNNKRVFQKRGFNAKNKTAESPQGTPVRAQAGLKGVALAPALLLSGLLSTQSFASAGVNDRDDWLAAAPSSGYTVQLATSIGHKQCLDYAVIHSAKAVCLESSTVGDRWYVVSGDYDNFKDATAAAGSAPSGDAFVNSIKRLQQNRCDMSDSQGLAFCASDVSPEVASAEATTSDSEFEVEQQVAAADYGHGRYIKADFVQYANSEDYTGSDDYSGKSNDSKTDHSGDDYHKDGKHVPRLSDKPKPYLTEKELGERTAPLIEWGGDFLGTGNINRGFILPGGAVWTPQFWVYGTGRSAYQTFERPGATSRSAEWVNRLDLFGNLQLSGTERVLIGISPLHREDVSGNRFTGLNLNPDDPEDSINRFNARVRTLFFEGDLAELFPANDPGDRKQNDIGFTIGRQGVLFQDGMTINDTLDAFGLSKNNIRFEGVPWLVNWRSSVMYAWNEVNRGNNQPDDDAELYAWFNQWDTLKSTIDLDLIYVDSDNDTDQFVASLNFIQRLGKIGSTFRIAHSAALDEESSAAADGTLLFSEFNYVPAYTKDNMYLNVFASFDNYTSAARDPLGGGPLGRVGLLYAASGLGSYPAPLSNDTNDAYGFSAGYQKLDDKNRRQFTVEVGARDSDDGSAQYGLAARFQQALGKRFVLQIDGFVADQEDFDSSYGARLELLFKL
jgi:hypothetical protein